MMPTRFDYYTRRAREHRLLAATAGNMQTRSAHQQIANAYRQLARRYRAKQVFTCRPQAPAIRAAMLA